MYTDHKNLTCNFLNTDRLLRCRFILEEYGTDIEYIQGNKNIVEDALSIFPINRNQETTHEYIYKKGNCVINQ